MALYFYLLNDKTRTGKAIMNFIYSHPFEEKSYIISTEDGKEFAKNTLNVGDLHDIADYENKEKIEFTPTYTPKL